VKKKIAGVLAAIVIIGVALFQVLPVKAASGVLDHVQITPTNAVVAPGGTVQFVAQGYDDGNVAIAGLTYGWSYPTAAGVINGLGLFTAGSVPGTYIISVTATQNVSLSRTASVSVTVSATVPPGSQVTSTNLDTGKLTKMLAAYLNSVGFDNFLGGQWQVKNGTSVDTIKAIPGTVQVISPGSLMLLANGQTVASSFVLGSNSVVLPKGTQLAVNDRVVVITINDQVKYVIKITPSATQSGTSGQVPPGLRNNDKGRPEDKGTPPGWSHGKKVGWEKD
jgi:hypothetical protein